MDGNWVLFRGERNIVSNCLISVITAHKMLKKMVYILFSLWFKVGKRRNRIGNIPIVKEFPDVFSKELLRLHPKKKEVEVSIDIIPRTISSA